MVHLTVPPRGESSLIRESILLSCPCCSADCTMQVFVKFCLVLWEFLKFFTDTFDILSKTIMVNLSLFWVFKTSIHIFWSKLKFFFQKIKVFDMTLIMQQNRFLMDFSLDKFTKTYIVDWLYDWPVLLLLSVLALQLTQDWWWSIKGKASNHATTWPGQTIKFHFFSPHFFTGSTGPFQDHLTESLGTCLA